jgi:hypothetical protein
VQWGLVAGLALWNKDLVTLLALVLGVALVAGRRWRLLISPWLVGGGALALVIASPQLVWQSQHAWPQAQMARVLADRLATVNRTTLLPSQLVLLSPVFVPFMFRGVRWPWPGPSGSWSPSSLPVGRTT